MAHRYQYFWATHVRAGRGRLVGCGPDDRGQLFGVLLEVADDEAVGDLLDRHLAATRVDAESGSVARRQRLQSPGDAIGAGGDPVEELARRERAVALEDQQS
jgi:hypothetical protein